MKLYEIDAAIESAIASAIDPETGEIADTSELDALNMEREQKVENMIGLWKNQAAEIAALKAEADNLTKRAAALNKRNDRLKDFIAFAVNHQNFKSGVHEVRFRKTPEAVKIADGQEEAVIAYLEQHYDNCLRFRTLEVKKNAVKELVKNGVKIPGVTLESGTNVNIL